METWELPHKAMRQETSEKVNVFRDGVLELRAGTH